MVNAKETKRLKAKQMRYKKPIVKGLNLESIQQELLDIQEQCEDVHWYFDSDDDSLINALDGDEDEAYEFRMMFADLCAECEQMREDLKEEWVPECFDRFFVAAGAGEYYGGILGYDSYECDYMRLSCTDAFAEDETKKVLMRLTKDELIAAIRQCFKVFHSFISLQTRYSYLKATMDILRDENTGYLQMVKQIEELYNKLAEDNYYEYGKAYKDFIKFTDNLPNDAWLQ